MAAAVVIPEFFIVYLPEFNEDRMKIPNQFVQHMRGKTSGSVYLTGPSGNTWTLQLAKNKDGLYFDEGWTNFVKDHMIQVGEFLVFKYDGKSGFGVVIYGYNACEKKTAFYAKCSQPAGDVDFPKVVQAGPIEASPKRTAGRSMFEEEDEPDIENSAPMQHEREYQRPAKPLSSRPPFFLVPIKKYNLDAGFVRIPFKFLKKNGLKYKHNDKIVLHDQKGQSKAIKLVGRGKEFALSAGWMVFARNSGVRSGDVCMFELVSKYEMQMYKIRNDITVSPSLPCPRHPHPHPQHQQVKIEISD